MKRFFLICAAIAVCIYGGSWQLCGQITDVSATVQFGNGQTAVTDFSDPIGVQPGEVVSVTIQFGSNRAGEAIKVGSLDGGRISNTSTAVSDEGLVTFSFQAAGSAGQNRVVLRYGLQTLLTHFWVLSSNPQNNPAVVTPANPES